MLDFNKVFRLKIVSLIISISFLLTPSSYPYSSKDSLRVPMGQKSTNDRVIEAISAETEDVLNEKPEVKNNGLRPGKIGIYKNGQLIGIYSRARRGSITKDIFNQLDKVVIKGCRLNKRGTLGIGNRTWATFTAYPNSPVDIYIERGRDKAFVTGGRILNEKGELIEDFQMCRYENSSGELLEVYNKDISQDKLNGFSELGDGIIKGRRLDENGFLSVGERRWGPFTAYPNSPVDLYIERGKDRAFVTRGRILNEKGELLEEFSMGRYESFTGELLDVFYRQITLDTLNGFSELGDGIIKGRRLNESGGLNIRSRTWATFTAYPNSPVDIYIERGRDKAFVTGGRILNEKGELIEEFQMGRYENSSGELLDVFYKQISPEMLNGFSELGDGMVNCNSYCENFQFKTPDLLFVTSKTNSFGVL